LWIEIFEFKLRMPPKKQAAAEETKRATSKSKDRIADKSVERSASKGKSPAKALKQGKAAPVEESKN
jgi:hypothetical protein